MGRFNHLTLEELYDELEEIDKRVPAQRVLVAIGHKLGDANKDLAPRHNVSRKTIRNWLDRFEEQPVEQAPYDAPRSGRPAKLTDQERERFFEHLRQSPAEFGYESQAWSPVLVHDHLETEFGVKYTLVHIRRLMHEAGLTWRTARPRHYEADPEQEAEFQNAVKKTQENGSTKRN